MANSGTKPDALDPTGTLAELSRIISSGQQLGDVVGDIVQLARSRIPGTDEASLTLIESGVPGTAASTASLAVELDERQYETGWGPCLDSAAAGELLVLDDIENETRWPQYVQKATELGVHSSVSAPLPTQDIFGGGLNLYARRAHAFTGEGRELAMSFAAHIALAVAQAYRYDRAAHEAETLRAAMASRAVIEQAKGILMAARQCDAEEAFNALVKLSQRRHVKLRALAADIVTEASGHPIVLDDE
jgi:GAF domain-containing protein